MIFITDWHGSICCSLIIGGARLMHGPFSKILGAPPGSTPLSADPNLATSRIWFTTDLLQRKHQEILAEIGYDSSGVDLWWRLGELLSSTLLFSFVNLPSSSPTIPLEIGPLKCSQWVRGVLLAPQLGSGWSPSRNRILYIFIPKNLTSCGNDSNDFPDNQLAKFRTV